MDDWCNFAVAGVGEVDPSRTSEAPEQYRTPTGATGWRKTSRGKRIRRPAGGPLGMIVEKKGLVEARGSGEGCKGSAGGTARIKPLSGNKGKKGRVEAGTESWGKYARIRATRKRSSAEARAAPVQRVRFGKQRQDTQGEMSGQKAGNRKRRSRPTQCRSPSILREEGSVRPKSDEHLGIPPNSLQKSGPLEGRNALKRRREKAGEGKRAISRGSNA